MSFIPDSPEAAEGTVILSGGSRRHVGGASGAAVKPKKGGRRGQLPIHTMYVGRPAKLMGGSEEGRVGIERGRFVFRPRTHSFTKQRIAFVCKGFQALSVARSMFFQCSVIARSTSPR